MIADVVVVGGGIWGLSTAYHLSRADSTLRIVVLERNADLADETTRQAAGQIGRLRSDPLMSRAVGYGLDLFSRFQGETGHDPGFRRSGSVHVALNAERMDAFRAQIAAARRMGVTVQPCDAERIAELAPAVDASAVVGGIHLPDDGYVDARRCALAFAAAASDRGVHLATETRVVAIRHRGGRIERIETSRGTWRSGHVVVTCGPWSGVVVGSAGFAPPMYPIRLQQARTIADPDLQPDHPVVRIPDQSCYMRPERGGYLFGFFQPRPVALDLAALPEGFSTRDIEPPTEVIEQARRRLSSVLPIIGRLAIDEYRQGMVTCSPDAAYVVGPAPGIDGLWIATACGAMGIAGSAAVGRWLADWITRGDPGDDLTALKPDRFGDKARRVDWLRRRCTRVCADYYSLDSSTYSLGSAHESTES